jgi:phage/plasmid-like protein (TIGR03299 family)
MAKKNKTMPAYAMMGKQAVGSTTEEVLTNAGMNFSIGIEPIYTKSGKIIRGGNFRRVFRKDNDHDLGVVKKNYQILQPIEWANIANTLSGGLEAEWDRIGMINKGEKMFGSFSLPEQIQIGNGDKFATNMYLWTANDGSGAVNCLPTLTRLVCANQSPMAFQTLTTMGLRAKDLSIPHSSIMRGRIDNLPQKLNMINTMQKEWCAMTDQLLEVEMEFDDRVQFYIDVMGWTQKDELKDKVENPHGLATRGRNQLEAMLELEGSRTNTVGGMRDTQYQAYNVLTEFVDHHSILSGGKPKESTVNNTVFGAGARKKDKAWALLMQSHL